MADKKTGEPAPGPDIVQRYRFRVRTADGRELVSHIATVTRPAPAVELPDNPSPEPKAQALPPDQSAPVTPMIDVPVHQILVALKGMKQGDFKADPGFHDLPGKAAHHQFETNEFYFATSSPRDPATGSATGRRVHVPVTLAKETGPSTLQFYQALVTSETLPVVIFDCYGKDKAGHLGLAHSIRLTNARVASLDFQMPNSRDPAQQHYGDHEQVALAFQEIEWTHGPLVVEDSWS